MNCVQDYISDVRDYIDEPSDDIAEWSDSRIVSHMGKELRHIGMLIQKRKQDYFGTTFVIPTVTNTYEYEIPLGQIRTVDIYTNGVTAAGNGVYTISATNTHYAVDPANLNSMTDELGEGYYTFGTKLVLTKGAANVTTGNYLVIKMIRALPDLVFGDMKSATGTTFVFGASELDSDSAAMRYESNVYLGYGIKIYSGTGIGQERRIIGDSFDGTDHTLTVDTWDTTPSGSVEFSLTPPFPEEFEDPLTAGTAIRCKFKVEDPISDLAKFYKMTLDEALDMIVPRNLGANRRLRRRASFDGASKRIIVRRV